MEISRPESRKRNSSPTDGEHRKRQKLTPCDDAEGHYIIKLGEAIGENNRYKMLDILGEGTFGKVVEAFDRQKRCRFAVKIIKSIPKYRDAAQIELKVLRALQAGSPLETFCIELVDWFDFRGHICMLFPRLGLSMFDFMKGNGFKPFVVEEVQHFAVQLITAVKFLHSIRLTHTDLKPENILLVNSTALFDGKLMQLLSTDIRLIDFGSATFDDGHHTRVVTTRHYRAPEIIFELGWTRSCDLWSVGCILTELLTGTAMFQTHENLEHMAMMEVVLGPVPATVVGASTLYRELFSTRSHRLRWPENASSRGSVQFVKDTCRPLEEEFDQNEPLEVLMQDLVAEFLQYAPAKRLSAAAALAHPFCATFNTQVHADFLQTRADMLQATIAAAAGNAAQQPILPPPPAELFTLAPPDSGPTTHAASSHGP